MFVVDGLVLFAQLYGEADHFAVMVVRNDVE